MAAGHTVISGSPPHDLAARIARRLGAARVRTRRRVFADGEQKLTLCAGRSGGAGGGRGKTAVIVHSMLPPVDASLVQILALIHRARADYGAGRVVAVIPYMGYARQDREFLAGEIVTAAAVARLLRAAGASRIITVDIHSRAALGHMGRAGKNVSGIPDLAAHFGGMRLREPLAVSPDAGGSRRAGLFAKQLGWDYVALNKSRDRRTGRVRITSAETGAAAGRDLVLVDDMISTGGSIIKATEFLKGQGCGRVFVACTHALLMDGAAAKIRRAGVSGIISTNTVPGATSVVDVSGAVARAIQGHGS